MNARCTAPDRASCRHLCANYCYGHWRVEEMARTLLAVADREGQVVTIEQVPLQPLAMGNYETVAHVRPARSKA